MTFLSLSSSFLLSKKPDPNPSSATTESVSATTLDTQGNYDSKLASSYVHPVDQAIDNSWNVDFIGQIGGITYAVAVQGNYAYIGVGQRLVILDISDPSSPVEVGRTDIFPDALISDIAVSGDYAYVADGESGLRIVNVANPAAPFEVGFYDTSGWAEGVAVVGDYAYVADAESGLRIVNVTNPVAPIEAGFYDTPDWAMNVAVVGGYAFIADDGSGLRIVDISNPAAPVEVGFYDTPWQANDVAVVGDYAFIADMGSGLWIVNVANPAIPVGVGFYDTSGNASSVAVAGDYAYVTESLVMQYYGGLRIVNITNPASPFEVGIYDEHTWVNRVAVVGSYAYVTEGTRGLRIVNVTNPSGPVEMGYYDTPGNAYGVAMVEDYAYIADVGSGLRIVNVANPAAPVEVGFYDTPGTAYDVAVIGDYAYIADYESGLRIVNVANPADPVEVGFYDTPGNALGVVVAGGYAYVADGGSGLRIVNVANPAAPVEVGFYDTSGSAYGVAVAGGYAYVADGSDGLRVVNVANPAAPVEVGFYDTPGNAYGVAVAGNYAYVADGDNGLRIVNVANPAAPVEVGFYDTPGTAYDVAVIGDYAYIAELESGLRIVNIANSAAPVEVGFYDTPGSAVDLALAGDYAYVADFGEGLIILRYIGVGATYTISGRVADAGNNPIPGVTVSASAGYSALTDSRGNYTISSVITGTYTVTPSLPGYTFTPPSRTVSVPPDATGMDFIGEQTEIRPIILIPGMSASANWACFLFEQTCDNPAAWHWMPTESMPIALDYYSTLISNLAQAGYTTANNYLTVFFYDWRRPLSENALVLRDRIAEVKTATGANQVDLIGHSMGGLVSRAYIQSDFYNYDVAHLITLGSPHMGAVKSYPYWEAAYFYQANPIESLGFNILLRRWLPIWGDLPTVFGLRTIVPSLRDILYLSDYIYDEENGDQVISEAEMIHRNVNLAALNDDLPLLFARTDVSTFAGQSVSTSARFYVHPPGWWMWPNWDDGEPNWDRENVFMSTFGDGTVLSSSALLPPPAHTLEFVGVDHGGLPNNTEVIGAIFETLEILLTPLKNTSSLNALSSDTILVLALDGKTQTTVTDSLGQMVGPGGVTIPGAEYISSTSVPFVLILIANPVEGQFHINIQGTVTETYAISLLDTFNPVPELITNTMTMWDTAQSQINPGFDVTFAFTYTLETSPTTSLVAITPIIQTPVWVGDAIIEGLASPGRMVKILDADSHTLLGSNLSTPEGRYQVVLSQPLHFGQRIYPSANGIVGVPIAVQGYKIYLPITGK